MIICDEDEIVAKQAIKDMLTEIRQKATVRLGVHKHIRLSEVEQIISKYTGVQDD